MDSVIVTITRFRKDQHPLGPLFAGEHGWLFIAAWMRDDTTYSSAGASPQAAYEQMFRASTPPEHVQQVLCCFDGAVIEVDPTSGASWEDAHQFGYLGRGWKELSAHLPKGRRGW